jgi:hypothetical protein
MAQFKTYRKTPDIYPIQSIRVIDGDTIEAMIMLPFGCTVVKRIRLKGWWADEPVGLYAAQGLLAAQLLRAWIGDKALWLHAPSCRLDKYGRVIGHLMHGERIISGKDVLGHCQLSEKEHNARRAQSKAAAGIRTADAKSKSLISHPEAVSTIARIQDPADWPCTCGPEGTHQGLECCPLPSPEASNPGPAGAVQ